MRGVYKNIELKPGDNGFTAIIKESDGEEKNLTDKVHSCDECDFSVCTETALQKHINITHDGGQAIKCVTMKRNLKRILQYI